MQCINEASRATLPCKQFSSKYSDFVTPGWNDVVDEKHSLAREAYLNWVLIGRPRSGPEFCIMKRTRARFKLALRWCKQHEEMLRADAYADSIISKNYTAFWKDIKHTNNAKSTKYADFVGGQCGEAAITNMWYSHFKDLYNCVYSQDEKCKFYDHINLSEANSIHCINVHDIAKALGSAKLGKAIGPDGVAMEAFIYGGVKLQIHLCLLFNMFIRTGHLPSTFMQSVIVPLVKCKSGDLSDVNNYRAISISNAITKLFELSIASTVQSNAKCDRFQFGFKPSHSTGICTSVLKQTIDYYISRGSHVFTCFVDLSKAFDRVDYWKLFNKLLDDGVDVHVVRILAFWYSNQKTRVRWHNSYSDEFTICNGVRQGGILSPYLFSRYIRELLGELADTEIGCHVS